MTSFIALYRGDTVSEARLTALSADPGIVNEFAARLLESELAQDGKTHTVEDQHRAARAFEQAQKKQPRE